MAGELAVGGLEGGAIDTKPEFYPRNEALSYGTNGNSCYVRGCKDSEWFEDDCSCRPVAWRNVGAEPLWIIRLDRDEYSQVEAIEIARRFPEVWLTRSTKRGVVEQVKLQRDPHATYASRLGQLLAW